MTPCFLFFFISTSGINVHSNTTYQCSVKVCVLLAFGSKDRRFAFFCRLEKLNEVFNKKQKALLSFALSGYDRVVALLVKHSTLI